MNAPITSIRKIALPSNQILSQFYLIAHPSAIPIFSPQPTRRPNLIPGPLRTSNLEPRTSNLEPRTSNLEIRRRGNRMISNGRSPLSQSLVPQLPPGSAPGCAHRSPCATSPSSAASASLPPPPIPLTSRKPPLTSGFTSIPVPRRPPTLLASTSSPRRIRFRHRKRSSRGCSPSTTWS